MVTKSITPFLIFILASIGNTFAFEEDGFKTGMTMQEVKERLPKGQRLESVQLNDRAVLATVTYHPPRESEARTLLPDFEFCNSFLTSYSRKFATATEYFLTLKTLLDRFGQPNKIEIKEVGEKWGHSQTVSWHMAPEKVYLHWVTPDPATGKKRSSDSDFLWVTFMTQNPSCSEFD